MCCLVECCEAIDEGNSKIAEFRHPIVEVEFWHLSGAYIGDEKCVVADSMDAGDEWNCTDFGLYYTHIHY